MTHASIWMAIDKLAAIQGKSCSGLAKSCGLDATAFNKSKRWTPYGKPRWPSGNTISKLIQVSGMTDEEFFSLGADADNAEQ